MTTAEAKKILIEYNTWRRGDTDHLPDWVTPKAIGIALETAIQNLGESQDLVPCLLCKGFVKF